MTDPIPRITIRPIYVFVTVASLLVAVITPFAVWAFFPPFLPAGWLLGITLLAMLLDIVFARVLSSCYQQVELDGDTIRGRKLLTRRVYEWQVRDIIDIKGIELKELGLRESTNESPSQRGYEIEFSNGYKLLLSRHEMVGMDVFLFALADRIERAR